MIDECRQKPVKVMYARLHRRRITPPVVEARLNTGLAAFHDGFVLQFRSVKLIAFAINNGFISSVFAIE